MFKNFDVWKFPIIHVNTSIFNNTRLDHWCLLHRCYLDVLGLSFSTHSQILFSSEYFHYKIFTSSGPGIIDARARYRAAARRLRNTGEKVRLSQNISSWNTLYSDCWFDTKKYTSMIYAHFSWTQLWRRTSPWYALTSSQQIFMICSVEVIHLMIW
jgi:hypothetical protein